MDPFDVGRRSEFASSSFSSPPFVQARPDLSLSASSFQATAHAQAIFGRVILRDEIPEAEALALCDGIGEFKRRKREGKVQPELIPSFFFDIFFNQCYDRTLSLERGS